MAVKYQRNPASTIGAINNELQKIQVALEDAVSRTGTAPNQLEATLDANSQRIINLPEPETNTEPVRKADFDELGNNLRSDVYTAVRNAEDATDNANAAASSANTAANRANNAADATLQSLEDFENQAELALQSTGWFPVAGSFQTGGTITAKNQVLFDEDTNTNYSWGGELPKVVPPGSTVASAGGVGIDKWTDRSDASVRAEVAEKITQVSTVADLRNTEPLYIGQLVYVLEYEEGTGYGGGLYRAVESAYTGSDSEVTLGGARWRIVTENNVFPIDRLGAVKDDPVSVKDAFIRAIECVREAGSGTVYVGPGEWTMTGVLYEVNTSNITFHFDLGCHFKMGYVLLGWYPTAPGKGYSNVAIVGRGTIEALPDTMWHNDLVYVDGVELRDLTFIRPVLTGHFLDLMGSTNITVDGITVRGSNVEQPENPRLFSEFIQVGGDNVDGVGWVAKRTELEPLMGQGIGTSNTTLTNSVFMPYTDEDNVTTYPPRPIGNHGSTPGVRNIRIVGNEFKDIIRQEASGREAWLEMPTVDGVHISGNSFVHTNAAFDDSGYTGQSHIIALRGSANSNGVSILDNTFDITRPDGSYAVCIANHTSGADVSVTGNVFNCASEYSDLVALYRPTKIRTLGNSVESTGRRFLFVEVGGVGSSCIVQGNDMVFNPPPIPENYRPPVDTRGSTLNIVGNRIQHPSTAFRATTGGAVCTAAGNTMVGGATAVSISNGVLTGNVFNTTTAPVVTIDGVAQTSQGWDFVHVPLT